MDIISIFKVLGPLFSFLPFVKQRLAEREGGVAPESVGLSVFDTVLDDALLRLGTIEPDNPLWRKCVVGLGALFLRPDTFNKPAVREWLSTKSVKADLKAAVEAKIARVAIPVEIFERLVGQYMAVEATGENRQYAEGAINIAIGYLHASVQGGVRDQGTAAIVQATASETKRHLDEGFSSLIEVAGLTKNQHVHIRFTEEASQDLGKILRRRATPNQDTVGDLRKLLDDFKDGRRLAAANNSAKQEVRYWLARVEASSANSDTAEQILTALVAEGYNVTSAAWGLIDLAKGQTDQALKRLRDLRDMDSQTVMFHTRLNSGGNEAALAFVDALKPLDSSAFTPVGWNNVCATLFSEGRTNDAIVFLKMLSAEVLNQCTHLHYMYAISCLLPMIPPDHYANVLRGGFPSLLEHLLDSPDAILAQKTALIAATSALNCAQATDDQIIAERCKIGIHILRLLDSRTREEEIVVIKTAMEIGTSAVKLIWLARAHDIAFDTEPLERYLAHSRKMGGLTHDQLRAELYLLNHPERSSELVRFLTDEWENLLPDNSPQALTIMMVQALASLKDFDGATAFFELHSTDLENAIAARLELMLRDARGEDASDAAVELFKGSNAIEDLINLVQILEGKKHWKRLAPYSDELFRREPNFDAAMLRLRCMKRTRASARDIKIFLESTVDVIQQKTEIRSARAWAFFDDGDHLASKSLNDELLAERGASKDIALDINIAIRTGDWERFPLIAAKAFEKRAQLHSQMLLSFAKLVGFTDPIQALALAKEAVDRDGDDPTILIGAHAIAIAARRDDIAMPWIQKAAELSKDGALIRTVAYKEFVEFIRNNADSWKHKNEMYRTGQVPIHMAVSMFNAPLTQFLIGAPRRNSSEADVRRRHPIPIRSGKRRPIAADSFNRIALDITAIFVLSELGRLNDVIQSYGSVFISPRVMEVMLSDREKVAFHQPSRIAEVKPLLALLNAGRLQVVRANGDANILNEVGDEIASLLKAASDQRGQLVHPGVLFKVSSFMEEHANLGELAPLMTDPIDVATALLQEGVITQTLCDDGISYLQRTGSTPMNSVIGGVPLFLDGLAVQYLQQAKLLQPLINSGHVVSIHQSTVDEWLALLATEPQTEEMKIALNSIRLVLREGLMSGKVQFLTQSERQRGTLNETTLLPVLDLLDDISPAEVAVVDDRMFADNAWLTDSKGITVPLISSLDLLDALVERKVMTADAYREALHTLRARCFFCIPLPPDDLLSFIEIASIDNENVRETAELRVIREYLARLHSTDVLCTPSDFEYLDLLWNCGNFVIAKIWANDAMPIPETIAKANWLLENLIPNVELSMRFASDRQMRINQIAASQAAATLIVISSNKERRRAQAKWFEDSRLSDYFPANGDVLDEIAVRIAEDLFHRTKEVAFEFEHKNSTAAAQ